MDRKEFLEKIGIGAAFALTATCLGGCSKDIAPPAKDVDFTIDLKDDLYESLTIPGNYIIEKDVVIARSINGDYVAASVNCSHENLKEITYDDDQGQWFCTAHGARYDEEGAGLNSLGSNGLTIFQTGLDGNMLRVFS